MHNSPCSNREWFKYFLQINATVSTAYTCDKPLDGRLQYSRITGMYRRSRDITGWRHKIVGESPEH